jgi:hypothetical protein
MTQEEFGLDLFGAIKLIGRILTVQDHYAHYVTQGNQDKMQDALTKRDELRKQLRPQLDTLSDADAAEIVRRYPWVLQ